MTTQNHALLENVVKHSSILQIYEPVNSILLMSSSDITTLKYANCTKHLHNSYIKSSLLKRYSKPEENG